MHIREMIKEDIEGVYALECLCFSMPWSLSSLEQEINNPLAYYIVAKEEGQIIGYGGLHTILGEGEITNIAVHPQWRRQGIGEKLLKQIIGYGKHVDLMQITLEVRSENKGAQALYEKYDFAYIGRRKNYYQKPTDDALIMLWENK